MGDNREIRVVCRAAAHIGAGGIKSKTGTGSEGNNEALHRVERPWAWREKRLNEAKQQQRTNCDWRRGELLSSSSSNGDGMNSAEMVLYFYGYTVN